MTTHIIGRLETYGWDRTSTWFRSLRRVGFAGQIHMLTYRTDYTTLSILHQLGVQIHQCDCTRRPVPSKWQDLPDVLAKLPFDDWVILSDVSDVVYQTNPEAFFEEYRHRQDRVDLLGVSEGVNIGDEPWNKADFLAGYPALFDAYKGQPILNAGFVAGTPHVLEAFCREMYREADRLYGYNGCYATDQAALNMLFREPTWANNSRILQWRDAFCFTCRITLGRPPSSRATLLEPLPIERDGLLYPADSPNPFMAIHQYTDVPRLVVMAETRFAT